MVEEWDQARAPEVMVDIMSQSELHIELQRGKSVVVRVRKRTAPKAPGSPKMRGKHRFLIELDLF